MPDHGGSFRSELHLASLENQPNPRPFYHELLEHYPVCQLEPDGVWAISRYEDACFAERRYDLFSASGYLAMFHPPWLELDYFRDHFLTTVDPPLHKQRRTLINPAFCGHAVRAIQPWIEETVRTLVQAIEPRRDIEFVSAIAGPFAARVSHRILGIEGDEIPPTLKDWLPLVEEANPFAKVDPPREYVAKVHAAIDLQNEHFAGIIERRRSTPDPGLISTLVHAEIDGRQLDHHVLLNAIEQMMVAGTHPPVPMLSQCIRILSRRPDLLARLIDDEGLIPAFIEEALRYESIGPAQLRRTVDDVTVSGVTIPQGELVLVFMGAANHDPREFPDPDVFDLSRPNLKRHLGFGTGPHVCIGAALARLQAKAMLEAILRRFTRISCPDDDDLEWDTSWLMRSICALPVVFE